jgi:hypothetical protein
MNASLAPFRQAASNPRELARRAIKNPRLLEKVMEGLGTETACVKFGCAKALRVLSETRPDLLYPRFDFFVRLLAHPNTIFQWEAARVLSQLARVDAEDKFTANFDKYFAPIRGPVMITAANVIRGGARIAVAKPHLADLIAEEVLKVDRARYQSPECRNVAIGHAVLALGDFFELLQHPAPVLRFVRKQIENSRPATRKKAEQFLKGVQRRAKTAPA